MLVGHAHVDHVGSLPTIVAGAEAATDREVPVWMTEPTKRLAEIMLDDSARIQRAREERLGVRALADTDYAPESMRAAYTRRDVLEVMRRVRLAERGGKFRIDDTGLLVRYLPVPHVLGSCAIHLTEEETGATLLYTGDLGPVSDPQATLPQVRTALTRQRAFVDLFAACQGTPAAEIQRQFAILAGSGAAGPAAAVFAGV